MKKTITNLDDLFAAARREEPVISEENARNLLTKSEHLQSTSFIFSTKGIIMSTIGLSLATFIGYLALTTTSTAPVSKSAIVNAPVSNLLAHANTGELKTNTLPVPPQPPGKIAVPPVPPVPPIPLTPPKIDGIKPIPLVPEKYEKMGVSKKDDGTVSFSQKNENGKVLTMSFPENSWGIIIDDTKDIANAPGFAPLIVTDTKGNKRLMQFSSEANGMKMRGLQINSRSEDNEVDPEKINELVSNALKIENLQIGGKDGDIDFLKLGLDSNQIKELHDAIKIETETNSDEDNSKHKKMQIHININSDKDEMDTAANGKPKKVVININKNIHIDSTLKVAGDALKQAQKEIREVITKLHLEKLDSLGVNMKKLEIKGEDMNDNDNEDINIDLSDIEKQMSTLNDLVPVLVRTATSEHFDKADGITYNDGLIFWYSPDKEVLANIPKAVAENSLPPASASNILTKTILYPNPAQNKTTLHFTLSEPRTIAFSIHDLLGKRVLDGGSIAETSAGSYEHEINLSQLTAGVYLLVITTDKGEQSIERLVIEK